MDKKDADLVVGYTNFDPGGNPVYHAAIAKMAVIWAVVLAIMLGVVAYLISNGVWPSRVRAVFRRR